MCLGFQGVAAERLEAVLGVAELVERAIVLGPRGGGDPLGEFGETVLEVAHLRGATEHGVEHGALVDLGQLLGQEADLHALRPVHVAGVGVLQAEQDLDERRLAGAVVAHQGGATTRDQRDRDVAEQRLRAERLGQPRHRDHGW